VHDEIEFMPLEPATAAGADGTDLRRLYDVPVELAVEIGRTRMTIGQTLELRPGSVVSLNRLAGEPVDLLINGKPIARGEVVVIDEEFGLRVTDVVSSRGVIADDAAAGVEEELPPMTEGHLDPLGDPFAQASVDDLPLGGLPTPGEFG
jgi:flagellar motor switch protein FliN